MVRFVGGDALWLVTCVRLEGIAADARAPYEWQSQGETATFTGEVEGGAQRIWQEQEWRVGDIF